MVLHRCLDRRKLLKIKIIKSIDVIGTYVENFIVRAHGVVRTTVVSIDNHLELRKFLLALPLRICLLFDYLSFLFLNLMVVVGRLTGARQVMRCNIGTAAHLNVTRIITISSRVCTQIVIQI